MIALPCSEQGAGARLASPCGGESARAPWLQAATCADGFHQTDFVSSGMLTGPG
jgi:hypothetical protein